MKQSTTLKKLMVASCLVGACLSNEAKAQTHPLAFGPYTLGTGTTNSNFYLDYVGTRFLVNSPASVAGQKKFTTTFNTGTTSWGGAVTLPLVDEQIIMPPIGDSIANNAMPTNYMSHRIAFIYRGLNQFVCKARHAQDAGADAVVIINNIPGGPVGMASGTDCSATGLTVPIFMISMEDGEAIRALYRSGSDTARFTITPWGIGLNHDLGFVDGGVALSHAYALPSNQLAASGNPAAYNMVTGAFIANFGTSDVTDVALTGTLSFTASDASTPTVQHTETVNLPTFTAMDSIYAMFKDGGPEFSTTATAKGRYDMTYHIVSTAGGNTTDDFENDNTVTNSFYVTDSLYSKGRYDFTTNTPIFNEHLSLGANTGDEFIWGPMYYVKNAGTAISTVQYSLASNTLGALAGESNNILLFKWVDGSNNETADSVVEDGELTLVSLGVKPFDHLNDTSGAQLSYSGMGDPGTGVPASIRLDADSWYYLAIDVPSSMFLGCDGISSPFPRIYGRFHANNAWLDYTSLVATDAGAFATSPDEPELPNPLASVAFVNSVDSFNYANQKGLIPAVAMIANNNPPPIAVNSVVKSTLVANIFPNPASDVLNVAVNFEQVAKTMKVSIIDGVGRFVSSQSYNDVKDGTFQIETKSLKAGHYFMIINANGKAISRNFVITKN